MAIIKAPRNVKVTVPRHSAQTIGAKLDSEIKKQAKDKAIRVDTAQPGPELAQAIESASEWNSLLITARAERGPQWDIGTQQFLVEEYSDLYYDPTPLLEVVKKAREEEFGGPIDHPHPLHSLQQHPQHPHAGPSHHGQFPMDNGPRHQSPMRNPREYHPPGGGQHMDPRHGHGAGPPIQASFPYGGPNSPMRGPSQGGFPGGGGPPGMGGGMQGQFFGGNPAPTPMRMGSISGMGMDDGMGGMGGMGMGGMQGVPGGPPGMGRRMNMGRDGFMP